MDRCPYCGGSPYEGVDHFEVCQSESIILLFQIREILKMKSPAHVRCNVCLQQISISMFINHVDESHPQALVLIAKLENHVKRATGDKIVTCHVCDDMFPARSQTLHYSLFHPDTVAICRQVKEKLNTTYKLSIPSVQHSAVYESELLKEKFPITKLAEKPEIDALPSVCENKTHKPQESDYKQLYVKIERLSSHLYHECMINGYVVLQEDNCYQLMGSLRARTKIDISEEVLENCPKALSENFNLEKTCPHIFVQDEMTSANNNNTHTPVENKIVPPHEVTLKNFNPFVKIEGFSSRLYYEHISTGYPANQGGVDISIRSLVTNSVNTVVVSEEYTKGLKKSLNCTMHSKNTTTLGIADLKVYKKLAKDVNNIPMVSLLEKMIKKTQEKMSKKEVLYCQKLLKQFVLNHQEISPDLKEKLINARQYVTDLESGKRILNEIPRIKNQKIRFGVQCLLKKLLCAMIRVPVHSNQNQ